QKNRSGSIQVASNIQLAPSTSLVLEGAYLHHFALNIPWQMVAHDRAQHTGIYTRPGNLEFTSEQGDRLNIKLGISQKISPQLSHALTSIMQFTTGGTNRYRSYWQQIPENRLKYEFIIQPATDLSLALMTSYRSSTQWEEYQNLEGERYRSL